MLFSSLQEKFHMSVCNISLVITIKTKANYKFYKFTAFLSYIMETKQNKIQEYIVYFTTQYFRMLHEVLRMLLPSQNLHDCHVLITDDRKLKSTKVRWPLMISGS
jgi:hypothetical protein